MTEKEAEKLRLDAEQRGIKESEYIRLLLSQNRVVGTMKGKDLYDGHYDSVAAEVRNRYKEAERNAAAMKTKQKAHAPKKR